MRSFTMLYGYYPNVMDPVVRELKIPRSQMFGTLYLEPSNFGWGKPAPSADIVVNVEGEPTHAAVFSYEKGSTMYGGFVAQGEVDGPTALIVTYHAKPGLRAKFRSVMAADGVAQMERWKAKGVFASYRALFTAYAADTVPDMYLVVYFHQFTDLAGGQKIEVANPGGLPAKAQDLASADTTATVDIVKEESNGPTMKDSQFLILEYDVTVDMPKYVGYVREYVAPQFAGWMKTGALSSYASFVNQNPAGAPWSGLILLEYKDLRALSAREVIKATTRKELAVSDALWKKWSDDKTTIRKEKAAVSALSLN